MSLCAVQGSDGLELQQLQPGQVCAGVVLVQPDDIPPNPFALSMEDGAAVSGAVASVWLAAWAWRAIYSVLRDRGED